MVRKIFFKGEIYGKNSVFQKQQLLKANRPSRVRNAMKDLEESEAATSHQLFHVLRFSANYGMLACF